MWTIVSHYPDRVAIVVIVSPLKVMINRGMSGWFSDQGWLVYRSIHPSIQLSTNYQPTVLLSAYHASSFTKNGCKGGSPLNPSINDPPEKGHIGTPEFNGSADFPIEIAVMPWRIEWKLRLAINHPLENGNFKEAYLIFRYTLEMTSHNSILLITSSWSFVSPPQHHHLILPVYIHYNHTIGISMYYHNGHQSQ